MGRPDGGGGMAFFWGVGLRGWVGLGLGFGGEMRGRVGLFTVQYCFFWCVRGWSRTAAVRQELVM